MTYLDFNLFFKKSIIIYINQKKNQARIRLMDLSSCPSTVVVDTVLSLILIGHEKW